MASATVIKINPLQKPVYAVPTITQASADKVSELLRRDFEEHHIFFNDSGFHNHIVHGLLSLYGTGANPEQLQRHYVQNASYQRTHIKKEPTALSHLHDPVKFDEHLGDEKYFLDYIAYFQQEIESKGWQQSFKDAFLKRDERSDDLLVRLYSGLLHPIIHLGFGIEFEQPVIMASGYGEACVHGNYLKPFYKDAENAAKRNPVYGRAILDIVAEGLTNTKIKSAPRFSDENKVRDGILGRAKKEIIDLVSSYQVEHDKIEERLAEMISFDAYMMAAAQHPPKRVKFDFFLMHCHNCGIFLNRFLTGSWLTKADKARLLEWKVRSDLLYYFAGGAPHLSLDEIKYYKPQMESGWEGVFSRCNSMSEDDGHLSKCLRALKAGEEFCGRYPNSGNIEKDLWLKMGHMAIDAVEDKVSPTWVFQCGFDEAWVEVAERHTSSL